MMKSWHSLDASDRVKDGQRKRRPSRRKRLTTAGRMRAPSNHTHKAGTLNWHRTRKRACKSSIGRLAVSGADLAGRLLLPPHVRALPLGQSFEFSLTGLVRHGCQLLIRRPWLPDSIRPDRESYLGLRTSLTTDGRHAPASTLDHEYSDVESQQRHKERYDGSRNLPPHVFVLGPPDKLLGGSRLAFPTLRRWRC